MKDWSLEMIVLLYSIRGRRLFCVKGVAHLPAMRVGALTKNASSERIIIHTSSATMMVHDRAKFRELIGATPHQKSPR